MAMPAQPSMSPAGMDLGLGGALQQQVAGETEDERKKRMLEMQQQQFGGSLAVTSLFGRRGSPGGAY